MKIGIIGSRTFNKYNLLTGLMNRLNSKLDVKAIVSGGAKGADSLGEKWANENGIETIIYLPNWDLYKKRAGFIRNELIVKESDLIVAFWDQKSKGTLHSINLCKTLNTPCYVIKY
jgi:hypothetical protein